MRFTGLEHCQCLRYRSFLSCVLLSCSLPFPSSFSNHSAKYSLSHCSDMAFAVIANSFIVSVHVLGAVAVTFSPLQYGHDRVLRGRYFALFLLHFCRCATLSLGLGIVLVQEIKTLVRCDASNRMFSSVFWLHFCSDLRSVLISVLFFDVMYRLMARKTRFMGRIFVIWRSYFLTTRHFIMMLISFYFMFSVNAMIEGVIWLVIFPR